MTIEWGGLSLQSLTTSQVLDPGDAPKTVIDDDATFNVLVKWTVPPGLAPFLGGQFRLRCFAESVGPGPEKQIGNTVIEPVVPGQTSYQKLIPVLPHSLLGEGQVDPMSGAAVSGMYEVATVIQHLNPGPTQASGYSQETLIQIRTP